MNEDPRIETIEKVVGWRIKEGGDTDLKTLEIEVADNEDSSNPLISITLYDPQNGQYAEICVSYRPLIRALKRLKKKKKRVMHCEAK